MDYIETNIKNTEKLMKNINETRYEQLKVNRYVPIIKLMEPYIYKKGSILDIGIREGEFLKVLKDHGFEDIHGMDIFEEGIKIAKNNGFNNCYVEDAMNFDLNMKFKIITISHVIEHCPDINKVINNIDNHLEKNGILYVEVPKEKKQKIPTKHGHYYCFSTLKELHSFFPEDKWGLLELTTNKEGTRLKILLRKVK